MGVFKDRMHARIKEFSSGRGGGGWGGGPGQSDKKSSDVFLCFFSPQLILRKTNGQFQRNLSFSRFQRGSSILQGGQGPIAYSL